MIKLENLLIFIYGLATVLVFIIMVSFGGLFDSLTSVIFRELSFIISPYALRSDTAMQLYYLYNVHLFMFSAVLYIRIRNAIIRLGALYLSMSAITSVMLLLFPLDPIGTSNSLNGSQHIIMLLIIVFYTVASLFLFGLGFDKNKNLHKLSGYSYEISVIILLTGLLTGFFAILSMPEYVGLVQKVPILAFLAWIVITSFWIIKSDKRIKYTADLTSFMHKAPFSIKNSKVHSKN